MQNDQKEIAVEPPDYASSDKAEKEPVNKSMEPHDMNDQTKMQPIDQSTTVPQVNDKGQDSPEAITLPLAQTTLLQGERVEIADPSSQESRIDPQNENDIVDARIEPPVPQTSDNQVNVVKLAAVTLPEKIRIPQSLSDVDEDDSALHDRMDCKKGGEAYSVQIRKRAKTCKNSVANDEQLIQSKELSHKARCTKSLIKLLENYLKNVIPLLIPLSSEQKKLIAESVKYNRQQMAKSLMSHMNLCLREREVEYIGQTQQNGDIREESLSFTYRQMFTYFASLCKATEIADILNLPDSILAVHLKYTKYLREAMQYPGYEALVSQAAGENSGLSYEEWQSISVPPLTNSEAKSLFDWMNEDKGESIVKQQVANLWNLPNDLNITTVDVTPINQDMQQCSLSPLSSSDEEN